MDDESEIDTDSNEEENRSSSEIRINLISSHKLDSMSSAEKLRFILDEVKKGNVLVLERGLTPEEEIDLIKQTMSEIDHESFIGIETPSFPIDYRKKSFIDRLFRRTRSPRMMVVGPAHLLKTIKKDGMMIQTRVLTSRSIVAEVTEEDLASDEEEYTDLEEGGEESSGEDGQEADVSDDFTDEKYGDNESDNARYHTPAEEVESSEATVQEAENGSSFTDSSVPEVPLAEIAENSADPYTDRSIEQSTEITTEPPPMAEPMDIQPAKIPDAPQTDSATSSDNENKESSENDSEQGSSYLFKRLKQEEE